MNFIILYWLTSSIIYIHYQPKVSETRICFNTNNNTNVTKDFCKEMTITRINGDVPVFQYPLNCSTAAAAPAGNISYFKIIYTYSNKTSFNSSWVPFKTITTDNNTVSPAAAAVCFYSFCFICLTICLIALLILLGFLFYYYYYHHYSYAM